MLVVAGVVSVSWVVDWSNVYYRLQFVLVPTHAQEDCPFILVPTFGWFAFHGHGYDGALLLSAFAIVAQLKPHRVPRACDLYNILRVIGILEAHGLEFCTGT